MTTKKVPQSLVAVETVRVKNGVAVVSRSSFATAFALKPNDSGPYLGTDVTDFDRTTVLDDMLTRGRPDGAS